ncbi:MAG: DNA methyltransferase [Polyangiales bacterium]
MRRPQPRRSLSSQGGPISLRGDEERAAVLAAAWGAAGEGADDLTHGFHTYPARMPPGLARALIAAFSRPGDRVLDPFCGSGTVLVEAMLAGRHATGVDASPLALRIAEAHCALRTAAQRAAFERSLQHVTEASLGRVRERVKARAPLSARQRAHYGPHVLLELAGLLEELRRVQPESDRRALEVVFSSLLVKFSNKLADTSEAPAEKRIRKGLVSEFFLRKGQELSRRWEALAAAAPADARAPSLVCGDSRALPRLLSAKRFELVLSSPPYGGTYDYHSHHDLRYAWLGLDASAAERAEIGARRRLSAGGSTAAGARRWDAELDASLRAMAAVCAEGAWVVLVLGDAEVAGTPVDALLQLERLAPAAGLTVIASAAEPRRDYRGGPQRSEHIVLLRNRSRA